MAWLVAAVAIAATIAVALMAQQLRRRLALTEQKFRALRQKLELDSAEMKRLSAVDPLTGLANRRVFDEVLEKEWARAARSRKPLAVIMADIDRFKLHNDTYGHQAGDECLKTVAATLRRCVCRPADVTARYGGEEFAVILPGTDVTGAVAVAERIRIEVQTLKLGSVNTITGHDVTISLGVGVVVPDSRSSPAALVASADQALYRAKQVGRNQVIVADITEPASQTIEL